MPPIPEKRVPMLHVLIAILVFFHLMHAPAVAQAQNVPDCTSGTCSGVGPPAGQCRPGQIYTQVENAGTQWTCSGLPPVWTLAAAQDATARTAATAAQSTATNAQSAAATAQSTASNAQSMASSAQTMATAALTAAQKVSPAGTANVVQQADGNGGFQADLATTDNSITHTFQVLQHVAKLPKIDATHSDFGTAAGCANAADPTGVLDSTCAVQAALAYSVSQSHTMFGVSMGVYYPVYLPAGIYKINGTLAVYGGQALIGDARTVVTLKQTNGTATLVVLEVNSNYNGIGTSDTVIANLNLIGSGHLTRGSLLEINTPNIVLDNVQFSNTGGREQQINNAERITTLNPTYSYGRWPVVLAGDVNESYFYNVHLTYAQQTNEPSPSGSKYGNWCYGVNCITTPTSNASSTTGSNYAGTTGTVGSLPAGNSNSATPNPLYTDPYCAIYIEKAINVGFYGGTDKNNYFNCGLRSASAGVTTVDHFYMEASTGATPYGPGNSAYITGGAANQTYFTGAPVLVSGTYNTSKGNLYSAPVADTSWQALFYGNTADAVLYWSGNYNPYVIVPQDYNPLSSTASAYATGVNQNQLERVLIAGFTADGHAIFARNQAGSSVPANYAWPAGSIIEDLASTSGSNSLTVSNSHMQNTQSSSGLEGNASSGYYQWTYAGQFPGGEIVSGVPGDTVAFNADPSLNKNGVNRGFNAPGDYGSGITRYLTLNNNEYFNAGNNKYAGSINAISSTDLTVLGYTNNPDSPFLANTASQAAALGRSLPLGNINGGGSVFAPLAGDGVTVTPVYFVAPNEGIVWDAKTGFLMQNGKEFNQSGGYRGGIQFQNEFSIFDSPTSGGQPNMELKMVTNNAGFGSFTFQAVSGGTNTPWATISPSGVLYSINPYTTLATVTMANYQQYIQWNPGTTAGTLTLPAMATGKKFIVYVPTSTTAAITFHAPSGTISGLAGSLTANWTPANSSGVYEFETDGVNYQLLTPIGINGQCTAPALPKFTNGIATSCQ